MVGWAAVRKAVEQTRDYCEKHMQTELKRVQAESFEKGKASVSRKADCAMLEAAQQQALDTARREVAIELNAALEKEAKQRLGKFTAQGLANTTWAFATVGRSDDNLFAAASGIAEELRVTEFCAQALANTAWAFRTVGEPAPAVLDPILALDVIEAKD